MLNILLYLVVLTLIFAVARRFFPEYQTIYNGLFFLALPLLIFLFL